MKKNIILSFVLITISFLSGNAQNLKIVNIHSIETNSTANEFPFDLNGNKCALVELNLINDAVAF